MDECEPSGRTTPPIAKATIDRLGITVFETLDHHEEHESPLQRPLIGSLGPDFVVVAKDDSGVVVCMTSLPFVA